MAEKMGYMVGMSRKASRDLMSTWNLFGYDAEKGCGVEKKVI